MNLKNKLSQVVILGGLVIAVFAFFLLNSQGSKQQQAPLVAGVATDGQQTIEIVAKGGYSPARMEADANKSTILNVKTMGTFDCSSALTIPALNLQKMLPPSGITQISIPPQAPGTELVGTCSMGMYSFVIKFV